MCPAFDTCRSIMYDAINNIIPTLIFEFCEGQKKLKLIVSDYWSLLVNYLIKAWEIRTHLYITDNNSKKLVTKICCSQMDVS